MIGELSSSRSQQPTNIEEEEEERAGGEWGEKSLAEEEVKEEEVKEDKEEGKKIGQSGEFQGMTGQ